MRDEVRAEAKVWDGKYQWNTQIAVFPTWDLAMEWADRAQVSSNMNIRLKIYKQPFGNQWVVTWKPSDSWAQILQNPQDTMASYRSVSAL